MKTILTNSITTSAKQPFLGPSLAFLQTANKEVLDGIVKALYGTYTTNDVLIMQGCSVTFPGSLPGTGSVTSGFLYYNGEIYLVSTNNSISLSSGQTLVWTLDTSTYDITIDPVTFSDLSTHDVHQIKTAVLVAGSTGSGIADYNEATVKTLINPAAPITKNSTSSLGSSLTGTAIYWKDNFNNVSMSGEITFPSSVSLTSGNIITLPSDFKPSGSVARYWPAVTHNFKLFYVRVTLGGFVEYWLPSPASDFNNEVFNLDVISFMI